MFLQNEQTIPCPVCKAGIPFDAKQLLLGVRFVCPGCGAGICLSAESKDVVEKALTAFEIEREKLGGKTKWLAGDGLQN